MFVIYIIGTILSFILSLVIVDEYGSLVEEWSEEKFILYMALGSIFGVIFMLYCVWRDDDG